MTQEVIAILSDDVKHTEHEYLRQAQAGDYDAYDELHRLLQPALTRFVRRLIGDIRDVEDIVQDTLISLYTHLNNIDPVENLRPYVFRIARNRAYDVLRRQGRGDESSIDDELVQVRVSFNAHKNCVAPEDAAHWMLLHMEVQAAMELLPESQRQALILYSEEEMTYAQIAQVMDVNIGTIKSRLFHAKKNLRGLLKPDTLCAIERYL